jgi:hypothetical protein
LAAAFHFLLYALTRHSNLQLLIGSPGIIFLFCFNCVLFGASFDVLRLIEFEIFHSRQISISPKVKMSDSKQTSTEFENARVGVLNATKTVAIVAMGG